MSDSSAQPAIDLTNAATDVLAERRRQIEREGWTIQHDDTHKSGSMAIAAACYALLGRSDTKHMVNDLWRRTMWDWEWLKPRDDRKNLVRAGALILAEIERIDRAARQQAEPPVPVAHSEAPAQWSLRDSAASWRRTRFISNSTRAWCDKDVEDGYVAGVNAALRSVTEQQAERSAQPAAPHVGDSDFESWFSENYKTNLGTKQLARDAYAAGMGDPLAAQPASEQARDVSQSPSPHLGELMRLALSVADQAAPTDVMSECAAEAIGRFTYYETDQLGELSADAQQRVVDSVEYLHIRGAIARHPIRSSLIRFVR